MGRHPNTVPPSRITKAKRIERGSRAHRRFLAEVERAEQAIDANQCPNDGARLCKDGHCRRCAFRLVLLPPTPYLHRVPFNRRYVRKAGDDRA